MTRQKIILIADNYVQWCERVFKNKSNQTNLKLMSGRATQKFVPDISFISNCASCGVWHGLFWVCCVCCVVCDMDCVYSVWCVTSCVVVCRVLRVVSDMACVWRVSLCLASMLALRSRALRRRGGLRAGVEQRLLHPWDSCSVILPYWQQVDPRHSRWGHLHR